MDAKTYPLGLLRGVGKSADRPRNQSGGAKHLSGL